MDEKLYITDLIDREVLQRVQDAFSNMVGMAALTTDENGHPVTEGSNFTDYCMKFTRQTKRGRLRCEECDKYGAIMTHDTGQPTFYTCHSGLIDFAAPIMANGKMIGSFIGGQVLTAPPDKEGIRKVAEAINVDFDEYWDAIQKVKIIPQERIDRAMSFLNTISTVLSDMAIGKYNALKANEEVERAAKMKTDFLANMSHEIRTPMNAVIGMAEMALREDIPDAARSYIKQIKSSGRALLAIINDILDFSKIESGKMDIIPIEYDSMSLFNDVSNIIMTRLVDKDVELDLEVNPKLPVLLYGDNIRIRQVLINLANNAVKFTNEGHVAISVDFDWLDEERINLKIAVADTGIGIREEDLTKIFESFSQVDSKRNRNVEGTGLGLAITLKLIKLMGGELRVTSEYGKGSTFSFTIPQTVANKEPAMKIKTTSHKAAISLFTNPEHITRFLRDSRRLGIPAQNLTGNIDLEKGWKALRQKYGDDMDLFVFIGQHQLTDQTKAFVSSHPEVTSVFISDFISEVKLDVPNLRVVKLPLSCMNLSMIYNKEKISFAGAIDHDDDADFTAPDAWVLIVDDNAVNLTVAEGLIEPLKLKTATASSGKEALRKIKERHFDLVLMDHMMPEMDGIEATKIIRSEHPDYADVPILALTANAVGDAKEMFLSSGMDDFIAKPIEVRILISKIKQWLPKEKIIKSNGTQEQERAASGAAKKDIQVGDLDIPSALSLLGSEKLLWTVIQEFHRSLPAKAKSIRSHYQAQDWAAYTIEVHALKSAAKQIGAHQLSEMAAALEKAGKAGDISYITAHHDEAIEKYESYEPVLAEHCAPEPQEAEKSACDAGTLRNAFARIRNAAQNLDMDEMEAVCHDLHAWQLPAGQEELLLRLQSACDEIDMDSCAAIADEWEALIP